MERANERYKQVLNLTGNLKKDHQCVLYAYGNGLDSVILESLKKGLSIDTESADINNFPGIDSFKYLEAWGSVL